MAYDNNLTGVLFKNDRKEKETHPDYKGSCEINGAEFWISGWKKIGKGGAPRMSLSFTAKDAKPETPAKKEREPEDRSPW